VFHAGACLGRTSLPAIVEDAMAAAMWTGWIALLIMLPLALTSSDAAMRVLKRNWKPLHRTVYVAAVLTFVHWILSAFDPGFGYLHLAILAVVLGLRAGLAPWRRAQKLAADSRGERIID
jgi:sulfoxide reductase heme-binding subunit YedZ